MNRIGNQLSCLTAVAALVAATPGHAQAGATYAFDIPAGSLGSAIARAGRQAGVMITADPALVEGHRSAGLRGRRSIEDALAAILAGDGLTAVSDKRGGFIVVAAQPTPRPPERQPVKPVRSPVARRATPAQAGEGLPDIVVTASRTGTASSNLPLSVSVVDEPTLSRQVRQNRNILSSLEAAVPGLSIQPSEARTACGSRLRGRITSFQINGVPINEDLRQGSCSGPFTVSPFAIERVEVLRGGNALYGAGAPGGIVNLITRRAKGDALEIDATAQTSFNTSRAAGTFTTDLYAGAGQKRGDFDYYAGAGYTDGGLQRDPDGRPVASQAYRAIDLIGSFGLRLTDSSDIRLTTTFHDEDAGRRFAASRSLYPGTTIGKVVEVTPHPQADQARDRNVTLALAYSNRDLLGHIASVSLFYQDQSIRQRDNIYAEADGDFFYASNRNNRRFGLRSTFVREYAVAGGALKTSYGFDYSRNSFYRFAIDPAASDRIINFLSPETVLRTYALFGQLEYSIGRLTLSGGMRQEWYRGEITGKGYVAGVPGAAIAGAIGKSDLALFNAGAIYRLTDTLQLYAGFSQGAALSELGRSARNVTNAHIITPLPATSDQYEAGIRGKAGPVAFSLAGYYSRSALGAELQRDPSCAGQVVCLLIPLRAPQRFHGFEGTLQWDVTSALSLGSVLTWQRGKVYDEDLGRFVNYATSVAVPLRVTGRVDWKPLAALSLGAQVTHYGPSSYFSPTEDGLTLFDTSAVTVVAGSARYDIGPAQFYVTADNLFNARYVSPLGEAGGPGSTYYYRAQGRRMTLGVSARF